MVDDFEKSDNQVFDKQIPNVSFGESCRLEYKVSNNKNRSINIPNKSSHKIRDKLDEANERIERMIILSDKSKDKGVCYMAMSGFKKRNE